nr:UDP-glucuronic acid decarboxylase 4 [Tanacetum cinerariifolium]
ALRKEPMTVYGDGKQTRSFQYVSDLVEGLMRLMEGEYVGPFNLGNPGNVSLVTIRTTTPPSPPRFSKVAQKHWTIKSVRIASREVTQGGKWTTLYSVHATHRPS